MTRRISRIALGAILIASLAGCGVSMNRTPGGSADQLVMQDDIVDGRKLHVFLLPSRQIDLFMWFGKMIFHADPITIRL